MSKRLSNRAQRRKLERDLAKGDKKHEINNETLLYQIKYLLNEKQASKLTKSLDTDKLYYIYGNLFPKKYSDIRVSAKTFAKDDLPIELNWNLPFFEQYHSEISSFLQLQDSFYSFFLNGNYTEASSILDIIETSICYSHWSIEKRLLLAEYEVGFKKNKEVLTNIISDENDFLTNLLAKHQSVRIEKNLSHFKYDEIINRYVDRYNDKRIKEYLRFKLNFFNKSTYDYKGFFLNLENSSSIIDKYNTFIEN